MPTNKNMALIQAITVGSGGAASIEFTSIPQTYTDLVILTSLRTAQTGDNFDGIRMTFNGVSTSRSARRLYGTGAGTGSDAPAYMFGSNASTNQNTSNIFGNGYCYIPNYTSANNKSSSMDAVNENNATTALTVMSSNLWSNTSAISSIQLVSENGQNFLQYSTAYLYGVTSALTASKATGGTILSDGTYMYHVFTSSGTFTPTQSLTVDYLVIAGGGGGGRADGGGGGAGGLRSTVGFTGGGGSLETPLSLSATGYTVTVGAGGNGASSNVGTSGSNSVFGSITSTGGGGGGGSSSSGLSGGSGGGASSSTSPGGGTANQGYSGGSAGTYGGGGGGAGEAGSTTISSQGGDGVSITAFAIPTNTGVNAYYAGGGGPYVGAGNGPGKGGLGGGGDGVSASGTANTGGGGGAWDGTGSTAGNGGSGLVIVRYSV